MANGTRAPSTIVTINLTGQTEFNIPFEYLARKFVVVTLLGIDRKVLILNTDYRFVGKTIISLANPTPAGYTQLEIRRETSATERLVDFHDGSILRAYDLNLSQIQTLHVAEEARDLTADTIGVNDEGHLDARNRKIVNLAYAENGTDALPLGQVMQWNDSALNSANRAEAESIAAQAANEAAKVSASAAEGAATATAGDRVVTQANVLITRQNAAITTEDRQDVADMLTKVEAASGPSVALVAKVDKASADASEALSIAEATAQDVSTIEEAIAVTSTAVTINRPSVVAPSLKATDRVIVEGVAPTIHLNYPSAGVASLIRLEADGTISFFRADGSGNTVGGRLMALDASGNLGIIGRIAASNIP